MIEPNWSPFGGVGTVEDCAKVVEFLSTHLSGYVTGTVVPIEGALVRGHPPFPNNFRVVKHANRASPASVKERIFPAIEGVQSVAP